MPIFNMPIFKEDSRFYKKLVKISMDFSEIISQNFNSFSTSDATIAIFREIYSKLAEIVLHISEDLFQKCML